jgi:hypothetical protein
MIVTYSTILSLQQGSNMTRFLQLDQNPPFDSNEIESIDLSSITDSHLNSVTNGSAFASDNLKATSAESACLDST